MGVVVCVNVRFEAGSGSTLAAIITMVNKAIRVVNKLFGRSYFRTNDDTL
jgi:predicted nicotinamide N-methyase